MTQRDESPSDDATIDMHMFRSMATSFRMGLGFSFNRHDMAKALDRASDRAAAQTLPNDAALDALVAQYRNWGHVDTADAITALRARNAALQAQVTAQDLDAMAQDTAGEVVGEPRTAELEAARLPCPHRLRGNPSRLALAEKIPDDEIAEAARVRPLDLSNLLKHAFFAGRESVSGSSSFISEAWANYDPEPCPAYDRIVRALAGKDGS